MNCRRRGFLAAAFCKKENVWSESNCASLAGGRGEGLRLSGGNAGSRTVSGRLRGAEKAASAESWLEQAQKTASPETCPEGFVPDNVYLAIRETDDKMVGIIDLRQFKNHPLLSVWGGHIGYSVRPSEQRKGYGAEMLRLMLLIAQEKGLTRVMVTCHDGNTASEKIIRKNAMSMKKASR